MVDLVRANSQMRMEYMCGVNMNNPIQSLEFNVFPENTLLQIFNQVQSEITKLLPPSSSFYHPRTKRLYAIQSFHLRVADLLGPGENFLQLELQFGEEAEKTLKELQQAPGVNNPQQLQQVDVNNQMNQVPQKPNDQEIEIFIHVRSTFQDSTTHIYALKIRLNRVAQDIHNFVVSIINMGHSEARVELDELEGKLHRTLADLSIKEGRVIIARVRFRGG